MALGDPSYDWRFATFSAEDDASDGGGGGPAGGKGTGKGSLANYNEVPTYPLRPSFKDFTNALRPASQVVVFDGCPDDPYHPSSMPIYQTSTFVQPKCSQFGPYDYTRSGNPTRTALEKHVALLEKAHAAFAFTSGMAALNTVTNTVLASGDELLVGDDIYGGMHRLATKITAKMGVAVRFVDTTDLAAVARAITPRTRLMHIESPSNPLMRITDVRALARLLRARGVLLSIDSTMMSPCLMKPLVLGADIVVHSATKFFGGHADAMGGFVVVNTPELAKRVAFVQNAEGTALAPFDCWLFLRGIKTMVLRVERAQANARRLAAFLDAHTEWCTRVYYAGLPNAADGRGSAAGKRALAVHAAQCDGTGSVLSFTTGSVRLSRRFCDACRIFKITVSFGSCNSLCEMPCMMSHASIDADKRTLPEDLVRLSVGVEDADDLEADLAQAFEMALSDVVDVKGFYRGLVDKAGKPVAPSPAASPAHKPASPAHKPVAPVVAVPQLELDGGENLLFDSKFEQLELTPAVPQLAQLPAPRSPRSVVLPPPASPAHGPAAAPLASAGGATKDVTAPRRPPAAAGMEFQQFALAVSVGALLAVCVMKLL